MPHSAGQLLEAVLRIEFDVWDLYDRAVENRAAGPADSARAGRPDATHFVECSGRKVVLGNEMDELAVESNERAEHPVAQLRGAPDDRVEDWLHVGWGTADDTQDLAGCRLPLKRLGHLRVGLRERPVLLLQLGE